MKTSSRGSPVKTVNVRYVELHDSHTYCSKEAAHFISIWNLSFGYRNFNSFSMIVRCIYKKANRARADSIFMLLSTSYIGLGVLSMAALEIYGHFWDLIGSFYNNGSRAQLIITRFCINFYFIFSSILTAIITIDRLFIITWQNWSFYEKINFFIIEKIWW